MSEDAGEVGALPASSGALRSTSDRATHEQSPQAVSAVPVGIPSAVTLRLSLREDAGLRIQCDEYPGLILSHSQPDLVMSDILPALNGMGWQRPKRKVES